MHGAKVFSHNFIVSTTTTKMSRAQGFLFAEWTSRAKHIHTNKHMHKVLVHRTPIRSLSVLISRHFLPIVSQAFFLSTSPAGASRFQPLALYLLGSRSLYVFFTHDMFTTGQPIRNWTFEQHARGVCFLPFVYLVGKWQYLILRSMCPSTPSSLLACFECWKKFANEFLWWLIQFFFSLHFHFHFCSTLVFRLPIVLLKDFYLLQRVAQLKYSYVAIYCCCPIVAACARAYIGSNSKSRCSQNKNETKKKIQQTLDRHAIIERETALLVHHFSYRNRRNQLFHQQ